MDDNAIERLRVARNLALERHGVLQHAPVQAWINHHGLWTGSSHSSHKRIYWLLAVFFALSVYSGVAYMQHDRDHSDIDIEILTGDLPVDANVD